MVSCCAGYARTARRPPFTAEVCLRRTLICSMGKSASDQHAVELAQVRQRDSGIKRLLEDGRTTTRNKEDDNVVRKPDWKLAPARRALPRGCPPWGRDGLPQNSGNGPVSSTFPPGRPQRRLQPDRPGFHPAQPPSGWRLFRRPPRGEDAPGELNFTCKQRAFCA